MFRRAHHGNRARGTSRSDRDLAPSDASTPFKRAPPALLGRDRTHDANEHVAFYSNMEPCGASGGYIDEILSDWSFEQLERHHGYIQWIFPTMSRSRFNHRSRPIHIEAVRFIATDLSAALRVVLAYDMMLEFWGLRLRSARTGEVALCDHLGFEASMQHLNSHPHNFWRMTRVIESLGLLGFGRYVDPLVELLVALLERGVLQATGSLTHWRAARHVASCHGHTSYLLQLLDQPRAEQHLQLAAMLEAHGSRRASQLKSRLSV